MIPSFRITGDANSSLNIEFERGIPPLLRYHFNDMAYPTNRDIRIAKEMLAEAVQKELFKLVERRELWFSPLEKCWIIINKGEPCYGY